MEAGHWSAAGSVNQMKLETQLSSAGPAHWAGRHGMSPTNQPGIQARSRGSASGASWPDSVRVRRRVNQPCRLLAQGRQPEVTNGLSGLTISDGLALASTEGDSYSTRGWLLLPAPAVASFLPCNARQGSSFRAQH